ncbi:alpha/beta hydrolase family protein [Paraburkholderia rhizosphaerae]|uniref:Putative redox protein n=1 Tax=Paraburkholderia rhizosphaerae TaxID=480658 RepID=A0A4R8L692_9BURK|nr:alpha/beta fold hydrolase [Paraburkholderia rhizosphaerae]TDY37855.1 putative redox protein [Paraburkholderia rhizosphaerae]
MTAQTFEFHGARGDRLEGKLDLPDGQPQGWAILAHCFTYGNDSRAANRLASALAARGIGVLRFHFAGLVNSGRSFTDTTFAADVEDLVAAGDAMTRDGKSPSILIGHSLGGAAVLMAAGEMPGILAAATLGAPFDVRHVLQQLELQSSHTVDTRGDAEVLLADRPLAVRQSFFGDLTRREMASRIARLRIPLLVLHSPLDEVVDIENAAHIFTVAMHPKSFISLDNADHFLSGRADADYAAARISIWASRCRDAER